MEVVESNVQKGNIMPTLQDLYNWIKPKADVQRDLYSQTRSQGERRNRVNVHQETSGGKCFLCNKEHRIKDCRQFLNMTPKERANQIFKYKACVMCLNKHRGTCWTPLRCDQGNCNGRHNKLLHFSKREFYPKQPNPPPQNNSAKIKVEEAEIKEERSNLHQEKASAVFYQIMPVMLRNGNRIIKSYAFLDPGSSLTLLDEGIAEELQLEGVPDPLRIKWTQNVSREEKGSKRVKLSIMGKSGEEFTLTNVRTAAHLHLPVQTVNYSNLQKDFPYLKNLPISDYKNAQPKLLIGLNHSHLLYPIEKRVMGKNKPIAIRTELGWLIFGNISDTVQENHVCMIQEDERMHEMMQRYFTTEDFGVKVIESLPESKQDIRAKELIEKTLNYTGERYEIGLLWKEDDYQFPDSYNQAYKRLLNLEAKLKKDSQLKEWVIDTIKDYVVKGYARKLSTEESGG
ncbi:uncharacterized protein LOC135710193 [Ochlerotatus camptorhynchus]|uniref:uncharacterized protein LOC135710193 n=1 Tax=Ochlerotatus camptorhynchus TaxID=644619 RepID=UPI0031E0BDE4